MTRHYDAIVIGAGQAEWKIYRPAGAAELLGVKPTTLVSRIRKLGLDRGSRK